MKILENPELISEAVRHFNRNRNSMSFQHFLLFLAVASNPNKKSSDYTPMVGFDALNTLRTMSSLKKAVALIENNGKAVACRFWLTPRGVKEYKAIEKAMALIILPAPVNTPVPVPAAPAPAVSKAKSVAKIVKLSTPTQPIVNVQPSSPSKAPATGQSSPVTSQTMQQTLKQQKQNKTNSSPTPTPVAAMGGGSQMAMAIPAPAPLPEPDSGSFIDASIDSGSYVSGIEAGQVRDNNLVYRHKFDINGKTYTFLHIFNTPIINTSGTVTFSWEKRFSKRGRMFYNAFGTIQNTVGSVTVSIKCY